MREGEGDYANMFCQQLWQSFHSPFSRSWREEFKLDKFRWTRNLHHENILILSNLGYGTFDEINNEDVVQITSSWDTRMNMKLYMETKCWITDTISCQNQRNYISLDWKKCKWRTKTKHQEIWWIFPPMLAHLSNLIVSCVLLYSSSLFIRESYVLSTVFMIFRGNKSDGLIHMCFSTKWEDKSRTKICRESGCMKKWGGRVFSVLMCFFWR